MSSGYIGPEQSMLGVLATHASDVVALLDTNDRVAWLSTSATSALGWRASDVVGRAARELVHPGDSLPFVAFWSQAPDDERARHADLRVRLLTEAGYRWFAGSAQSVVDDEGSDMGIVVGLHDVDDLVSASDRRHRDALRVQQVIDAMPEPHVLLTAQRNAAGEIVDLLYLDANEAACAAHRLSHTELLGRTLAQVLATDDWGSVLDVCAEAIRTGRSLVLDDYAHTHAASETRYYQIRVTPVGEDLSFSWRDVTSRHRAQLALTESERRFRLLAENSTDVIVDMLDGSVVWVSPSVLTMLGWEEKAWLGGDSSSFVHLEDHDRLFALRERAEGARQVRSDRLRLRRVDGRYVWAELETSGYTSSGGGALGVVEAWRLIDDQVNAEEELRRLADEDALTGLMNRRAALERLTTLLQHERRRGQELAVAYCDLDNFKSVNDVHGHRAGDHVLRTVADRARAGLRRDDLVARLGGDEMLVVLIGVTDLPTASIVLDKVRVQVERAIHLPSGHAVSVGWSAGLALALDGEPLDDLLARADEALYRAKRAGGSRTALG